MTDRPVECLDDLWRIWHGDTDRRDAALARGACECFELRPSSVTESLAELKRRSSVSDAGDGTFDRDRQGPRILTDQVAVLQGAVDTASNARLPCR